MHKRTIEYLKDPEKEKNLQEINEILAPIEKNLVSSFTDPEKPICFIIGAPRSASTLLHQLIAETGDCGYITNFLARFWKAPYFGGLLEKALGIRTSEQMSFKSNYGRTYGWKEPHHFGYFWKNWFQFDENHKMDQEKIEKIDIRFFKQEITALESIFSLPMIFRSSYCGFQIPFLKKTLKKAKFIVCLRDPLYQAQSILLGRKAFFGNTKGWFSLKPKEYPMLVKKDEFEQVSGQIYYILKAIEKNFKSLNKQDYVIIRHKEIIQEPKQQLIRISSLVNEKKDISDFDDKIPGKFQLRNEQRIGNSDWKMLKNAIKKFFGEENEYVPFKDFFL